MPPYELVIVGGGVAGLSLAYHLVHSPLRDCAIVILDRERKTCSARTLSYWSAQPTPFDAAAFCTWNRLQVLGDDFEACAGLGAYRYRMLRGLDFYQHVQRALAQYPNVSVVQGTVSRIEESEQRAVAWVEDRTPYAGQWVFDSRFALAGFQPAGCRALVQRFCGWEIEAEADAFDPQTPIFMDFRTPQHGDLRFCYVLPFSARRALVEYVRMGGTSTPHDHALRHYVERVLGIASYRILAREGGANPLTDWCFPRRISAHVMSIGTRGGRVKPSSGYAFTRIQRDSAAIVHSLLASGQPFDVPPDPRFYRLCDALMLRVMARRGDWLKPLFVTLFARNPLERILQFLDEGTSPADNARLTASLLPELAAQGMARRSGRQTFAPRADLNR